MSGKLKDVVYQTGKHWVLRKGAGHYEVYRDEATVAVRCATFHFSNDPDHSLKLAIDACARREAV